MRTHPTLAALLVLSLGGCTYLAARDGERELADARTDHAVCSERQLVFPSDAYTSCRRQLADERQRRRWMELSLAQQQDRNRLPDYAPLAPVEPLRQIDPGAFVCAEHGAGEAVGDAAVIVCREQ